MDDLKQDVNLRAYANEKPVDAYKRDGYDMFEEMVSASGPRPSAVCSPSASTRRAYSANVSKTPQPLPAATTPSKTAR